MRQASIFSTSCGSTRMSIFAVFRFIPVRWGAVGHACLIIRAKKLITDAGNAHPSIRLESPLLWTRGIAARETLSYLDRNGIDAEPALFGAGISRRQLSQDDIGLPVASQYRFLVPRRHLSGIGLGARACLDGTAQRQGLSGASVSN